MLMLSAIRGSHPGGSCLLGTAKGTMRSWMMWEGMCPHPMVFWGLVPLHLTAGEVPPLYPLARRRGRS